LAVDGRIGHERRRARWLHDAANNIEEKKGQKRASPMAMNMKMSHWCDIFAHYFSTIFWTSVWISADAIFGETVLKISIFLFSLTWSGSSAFSMALTPSVM
jgi:hypothetical protein